MTIKAGEKVPSVKLKRLGDSGMEEVSTDQLLKGKKVVVFGLPGAFTPTCSAKHLPGFVQHAAEIKAKGVDNIVCMSVNDPFVMKAWGEQQQASGKVEMLPDGNGELTRALGLELDGTAFGLGHRSQRFAMVIEDGTVKSLHVDPPGAFEKTSAENIIKEL